MTKDINGTSSATFKPVKLRADGGKVIEQLVDIDHIIFQALINEGSHVKVCTVRALLFGMVSTQLLTTPLFDTGAGFQTTADGFQWYSLLAISVKMCFIQLICVPMVVQKRN